MSQLKIVMIGASLEQNGGIATVEKLILKRIPPDIEIQHLTSHDEGSKLHRVKVFVSALLALSWRLLFKQTDLVYIHLSDGGSALRKALIANTAFIFGKPVLMHSHGAEFQEKFSRFPGWLQRWISSIFRRCKGFIVLSKTWKDYYVNNLGINEKQVYVLPNPTELPEQIPNRANPTKVKLVFCGRVGERKGTFDLIQAFANLAETLKERCELIIAGDGEIERGQQLVASLNLTNKVSFLGWINSEQRDQILATADIFVLPSYNEGLPMAILEAMGWGLPILTTPVGGIPELVISEQNGLLVLPGDIKHLSEALQTLIENENLRLSLGKEARATVAPFDIKNYINQLENIYRSLL